MEINRTGPRRLIGEAPIVTFQHIGNIEANAKIARPEPAESDPDTGQRLAASTARVRLGRF